jgi:hypothetical protein
VFTVPSRSIVRCLLSRPSTIPDPRKIPQEFLRDVAAREALAMSSMSISTKKRRGPLPLRKPRIPYGFFPGLSASRNTQILGLLPVPSG